MWYKYYVPISVLDIEGTDRAEKSEGIPGRLIRGLLRAHGLICKDDNKQVNTYVTKENIK